MASVICLTIVQSFQLLYTSFVYDPSTVAMKLSTKQSDAPITRPLEAASSFPILFITLIFQGNYRLPYHSTQIGLTSKKGRRPHIPCIRLPLSFLQRLQPQPMRRHPLRAWVSGFNPGVNYYFLHDWCWTGLLLAILIHVLHTPT